jgi:hypothetical protein
MNSTNKRDALPNLSASVLIFGAFYGSLVNADYIGAWVMSVAVQGINLEAPAIEVDR